MDTQHEDPCPVCVALDDLGAVDVTDAAAFDAVIEAIAQYLTPEVKARGLHEIIGGGPVCPRQDSNLRPSDP